MYNTILKKFEAEVSPLGQHIFISFGTNKKKATVKQVKKSLNISKDIMKQIENFKRKHTIYPEWVKVDFVTQEKKLPFQEVMNEMLRTRRNYIDFGVSFDKNWIISFLPEVINANAFVRPIKGSKQKKLELAVNNVNHYLKHYTNVKRAFSIEDYELKEVIRFETQGYLLTPENFYELEASGGIKGVRKSTEIHREIDEMITTATHYLKNEIQEDGQYEYGRFPHFDRSISFYNILRHCSSTYSLIEGLSYLNEDISEIEHAFTYIHQNAYYDCGGTAYIYDRTRDINEIKLGQNAAYIFAVVEYIKNGGGNAKLLERAQKVAEGILTMIDEETLETYHVFNYPELSVKEKFRIIYYDGEAALALLRLYQVDQNEKWLNAVVQMFDKFIAQDYWKYHDHWLSYCTNELVKIKPEARYIEFGLKNVSGYLDYIYHRETTFPTFLEMLTAAYQLIGNAKAKGFENTVHENIDEDFLVSTLHHRANYQRAGYFYPEVAMYFKNPQRILGSFFIKHHGYRVRIDDIEHYLSGYIQYQKHFKPIT
ncbi:TPA: poly(glycerol-phosphate) alpha-glucosyltransferase [Staphylococcus delphini]|nr:poly(glycerol-phosphate) alpha-glucosyltransferase [Staphylococcus delphini]HEC2148825.1 poly(glycerol-phosphate) alpha-glucosyltransferase [Staphylococcus delphini]HEC2150769.1 poly(glycerol-phosphate) alpha-glucosyltransferase [Staphylococcus delphini]HEC2159813.1 poly(glycerol-phosphate) alpha-glucosyltransferase [Staphylococcus delphini]HEC2169360.1 poly(glycerol-phosphate) alpha-glucosyltransferase [Staphylococcus delphini]